ncbi:MAG: hypothetical protein PUE08_00845 [Eubacteriales bacterium]|nr:hypothetical protein [Eubacteriales bacterium]
MNNVSTKQMLDYLRIAVQMENDCRSSDLLAGKISARAREINSTKYYTEQQYLLDVARDPADLKKKADAKVAETVFYFRSNQSCFRFVSKL